jgi:Zn-dependent M32 family carboxypeptidase
LPEDEKQTLRDLRKETTRRFNEGFLSQDNAGKNIDQVFSEYQEIQKIQAVENWLKYCKRPLPKCFKEFIEGQTEGEKERLREVYAEANGSKKDIHRVLEKIDFETGEIIIT